MSIMESRTPKAVTIRAEEQPMPTSIMTIRILYRNMFLKVAFFRNESLLQSGGMRSSRIRFPGFADLGRIREAAVSRRALTQAARVPRPMERSDIRSVTRASIPSKR